MKSNETELVDQDLAFQKYYNENILPHTLEYEAKRQAAIKKCKYLLLPCLIASLAPTSFLIWGYINAPPKSLIYTALFYLCLLSFFCIWYIYKLPAFNFQREVRKNIYPIILTYFDKNLIYSPCQTTTSYIKEIMNSGIISCKEGIFGLDYVKIFHNGITIEIIKTMVAGDGQYFAIIILCTINNNFSGKTVVQFGSGRMPQTTPMLDTVTLEDPVFNTKFSVFSSNQVEARYLLTPAFMERLVNLTNLSDSGRIRCSFYDEKILILLSQSPTNIWFKPPSIDEEVNFQYECNMLIGQMNEIFSIIELLKLNQKS